MTWACCCNSKETFRMKMVCGPKSNISWKLSSQLVKRTSFPALKASGPGASFPRCCQGVPLKRVICADPREEEGAGGCETLDGAPSRGPPRGLCGLQTRFFPADDRALLEEEEAEEKGVAHPRVRALAGCWGRGRRTSDQRAPSLSAFGLPPPLPPPPIAFEVTKFRETKSLRTGKTGDTARNLVKLSGWDPEPLFLVV